MRFALLGDSPVATAVAQAVSMNAEFQLVRWVGHAQGPPARFLRLPGLRVSGHWEELLTATDVDAVIIAESDVESQPVVRQLLQGGKTAFVLPELAQDPAFFYELALFDAESPGKLFPLLEGRGHPLVVEMQRIISDRRLGSIRHVQFERTVAATGAAPGQTSSGLMSRIDLASAFLIDADLLRALFGPYNQVSASRSGDASAGFSLATVTLGGSNVPQAVWTATGTAATESWKLTALGDAGTAILEDVSGSEQISGRRLRLTVNQPGRAPTVTETTADSGAWLLEQFAGGVKLWDELAAAVELVDAVERSVRRRRTIDVYFETPSERGMFKTQMTAVGCSLLMLTLVAVVLYLVFEASIDMPQIVRQILVVLIFAPLGIFLALQLLLFLTRPASRDKE